MTNRSMSSTHAASFMNGGARPHSGLNNIERQVKQMKISDYYDLNAESLI